MKKYVDGEYIDLTQEELSENERIAEEEDNRQRQTKTAEERIAELENIIAVLLEGRTE